MVYDTSTNLKTFLSWKLDKFTLFSHSLVGWTLKIIFTNMLQWQFVRVSWHFKVAWYSFSVSILPKFERKLRGHKQRFEKIATIVVFDKDENLLWSGLQWHRSCYINEITPFRILLTAVFLGTGNYSSKIVNGKMEHVSNLRELAPRSLFEGDAWYHSNTA